MRGLGVALAEVLRAPGRTALRSLTIGGAIAVTLLFEGFRAGSDRQMAASAAALPAAPVAVAVGAKHFVDIRSADKPKPTNRPNP